MFQKLCLLFSVVCTHNLNMSSLRLITTKLFSKNLKNSRFKFYATQTAAENEAEKKQTHFGFQTIPEIEKEGKVHKLFQDVAKDYDMMNDAVSFGMHRVWKDIFMHRLSPTKHTRLLDMAGGTGDIAFRFLNHIQNSQCEEGCHVIVSDINNDMLEVGKRRSENLKHNPELISWKQENAENLSFEDNSFNAYSITFGIRNVTQIDKALQEAYRVLQPGGRFMCMEFSHLNNSTMQWLYDHYSFQVVPVVGHIITGKWEPYQYLVESIRQFPTQEKFKEMIEYAGFREVTYENLTMGVVAIHSGFKL